MGEAGESRKFHRQNMFGKTKELKVFHVHRLAVREVEQLRGERLRRSRKGS